MSTQKEDLYRVNAVAGNKGMPGAPLLHLHLLVRASSGAIVGQATQTQATGTSSHTIDNVKGTVRGMGIPPYTKAVHLEGSGMVCVPPPAIGCYLLPFTAHFAVDDKWNGKGGWTLGSLDVEDVPIWPEQE